MTAAKPARGTREHLAWMVEWVRRCAEETGKKPFQLRRDAFHSWLLSLEEEHESRPTRNDIDAYATGENRGAWPNLVAYAADEGGDYEEPDRAQLGMVRELAKTNQHRRKLERLVGDEERFAVRLHAALAEAVQRTPPVLSNLRKPTLRQDSGAPSEIICHVSDTHWGHVVDSREVPGGRYDYQIAARRMGLLCDQVARFKRHRDTALRLVLAGDLIEGSIHSDDRGVDALASQLDGARQIVTSMVDFFRHHFSRIHVETATGNHDRFSHRDHGKRPTQAKWDSHTTVLYRGLEAIFRDAPDVSWNIPLTPYVQWTSCGHRYFATHGDSVFSAGTPGKTIQLERIHSQLWKLESNEAVGRCDVVLIGHLHFPAIFRIPGRQPSAWLAINGAASGRTAFTQTLNLACSPPVQCFWECTPENAVGDYRQADLWRADDDARFDAIVPTPTPIGYEQRRSA
jgi:predicted phosphodiesterase